MKINSKKCSKCKITYKEYNLSAFFRSDKTKKDGFYSSCKKCCDKYHAERSKNLRHYKIKNGLKVYEKHNMNKTPEYNIWCGIKQRCYNKNLDSYKNYGGRGIVMSDEWKNSFIKFFEDMGKRPSNDHTIERVDNNKGYSKENCVWISKSKQSANRRNVTLNPFDNKETARQASIRLGGNTELIKCRLKRGWTKERAFTEKAGKFTWRNKNETNRHKKSIQNNRAKTRF
jgi:hypothetical protein